MGDLLDPWDGNHRGLGKHKSGQRSGVGCAVWLLMAAGALIETARRVAETFA